MCVYNVVVPYHEKINVFIQLPNNTHARFYGWQRQQQMCNIKKGSLHQKGFPILCINFPWNNAAKKKKRDACSINILSQHINNTPRCVGITWCWWSHLFSSLESCKKQFNNFLLKAFKVNVVCFVLGVLKSCAACTTF